jgi:solute carrier family 25 S-adenosylmethionine transporter 26
MTTETPPQAKAVTAPAAPSTEVKATGFLKALVAGGMAGMTVDITLFPIDTLKTRLQSPKGFVAAGGFTGVFRGVGAAAVGSAPGAALFFSTYETLKPLTQRRLEQFYGMDSNNNQQSSSSASDNTSQKNKVAMFSHMLSAAGGETMSCLVRVPTEVLKTKMQTNQVGSESVLSTLKLVLGEGRQSLLGPFGGLYRGFGITLFREIPFALIQFPLYEKFKRDWSTAQQSPVSPLQAAACGSCGGAIAAFFTTPLDVLKTRIMIGHDSHGRHYKGALDVITQIITVESKQTGINSKTATQIFLSGVQPRVMWISIGGFVFFGAYETYKSILPFDDPWRTF